MSDVDALCAVLWCKVAMETASKKRSPYASHIKDADSVFVTQLVVRPRNALEQAFEKHGSAKEVQDAEKAANHRMVLRHSSSRSYWQDTRKHKLSAVERIRLEHEESKRRQEAPIHSSQACEDVRQKLEPAPESPSESSSSGAQISPSYAFCWMFAFMWRAGMIFSCQDRSHGSQKVSS